MNSLITGTIKTHFQGLTPQLPSGFKEYIFQHSKNYLSQLESVLNNVDCIEIGTTNVCNRKCISCPVGTSDIADRLTENAVNYEQFSRILANLSVFKSRSFSLSLHEYNEPLKDADILDKYLMAGKALPQAELTLFTNGDMLHHSKKGFYSIERLLNVGIRHIRISIYDSNPAKSKVFKRIGMDMAQFTEKENVPKNRTEYSHQLNYHGENVLIRVLFLSTQQLSNRGGIIVSDKAKRRGVCSLPQRTLSIDYQGNLKMCCNVHHMEEGADTWMYGSLMNTPISHILMSEAYSKMRDNTSVGNYQDLAKCQVCDFYQKTSDRRAGGYDDIELADYV